MKRKKNGIKTENWNRAVLSSIPDGFVSGRLASEIAELFRDAANHRRLLVAIHDLAKLAQYKDLEADLLASMKAKEVVPPPVATANEI
jgi:hypothetical protein